MSLIPWSAKDETFDILDTDFVMLLKPGEALPIDQNQRISGLNFKNSIGSGVPFTWAASDEDSSLSVGIQYLTEALDTLRNLSTVFLSVKNPPTGSTITVDIRKETAVNSNAFATIFSTLPTIDPNEFTSITASVPAVFSDNIWDAQRRLQILLTDTDTNENATGLKVSLR